MSFTSAPLSTINVDKQTSDDATQTTEHANSASNDVPGAQPINTNTSEQFPSLSINQASSERALPPETVATITLIKDTLSSSFGAAPPHTVQRLAELLKNPNEHYRSLPKFLRALQRVISVSSTIDQFPLPSVTETPAPNMLNALGSDESLGGALLTPISWLKNDLAFTEGDSDTRMNGVSQGELLRQEQEMGIHSSNSLSNNDIDDKQQVHAQGPPTLGPEDLGPQPPGVMFPDLGDSSPEAIVVPESGLGLGSGSGSGVKQDEKIDASMSGNEEGNETTQNPVENDDRMDVDMTANAVSEDKAEVQDQPMLEGDTTK